MRAVTLTHNDFDGLGSLLMLMLKFRPEAHFFTNYYDFEKAVKQVIQYKHEHDVDTLLIADLSFSDHREPLERLNMAFEGKIFLVDHHMYPDDFWHGFNFKRIVDPGRCASRILYEDLKLNDDIKDPEFRERSAKFIELVDTWDCWRDTEPLFETAMYANELFLSMKTDNASLIQIARDQIGHHFGVFQDLASFKAAYLDGYTKFLQKIEGAQLIWRYPKVTFVFSWDFMPKLLMDEYQRGAAVVVAVQYGIFKVCINKHLGFTEQQLNELRRGLTGMDRFCHLHAFTYKTEYTKPTQIVTECKKISDLINKIL